MKKFLLVSILLLTITLSWFTVTNCKTKVKLEKIIKFEENISGYVTLTNSDLIILNLFGEEDKRWVEWNRGGKTFKRVDNIIGCKYSPDGKYYAYLNLSNKTINIKNNNDETIATIETGEYNRSFFWAYNSTYLLIKRYENNTTVINKYNIFKKTIEKIFEGIYFNPVMAEDENTIYFLKYNTSDYFDPGSDIVRYDLTNKKFEKLNFSSIQKLWIYDDYTVSPNGKIVVFQNCHQEDSALYVIDLENLKVIDRVPVPNGDLLSNYSWKPDSSFFIFTSDSKVFYKYTIPKY